MEPTSLMSALVGAQVGRTQLTVAAKLLKMNADQDDSVAKLLASAQQSTNQLASVAAGIGENLDITV